jgi:cystathionine beta-synthase
MPFRNVLETIGNTPMVEATRLDAGQCRLFLKLESQNPGGSIKDRMALSMVEAAERDGKIGPGGLLVEATAGNTGLGLALVAAQKGYRLLLVIPDKMAQEKIFHLRALGAEIYITRSDVGKGHPEYYQDLADRLAQEQGGFYVNQFANPANPDAHERTTGPEIWEQMDHDLDAVVVGVGSGGTLTGIGRFLKGVAPNTKMILADPQGSVLAPLIKTGSMPKPGSWVVEGIGEDFVPPNCDLSLASEAITVTDAEALTTARELLRKEGILGGSSTGTLLAAALRWCREQKQSRRVVTLVCDSGNKYLSKMFNDFWMLDQGFIQREHTGDLRDLITRRHSERATVTLTPDDTLMVAYSRMKLYDVSQLPVLERGEVVGIIDESDLLLAVYDNEAAFREPVRTAMTARLETVDSKAALESLLPIFALGHVAIVKHKGAFAGLITRIDLINHLRRRLK